MPTPRLLIIVASVRSGRVGAAVGEWVAARAESVDGVEVDVADLAEVRLPLHDEPHHPRLRDYVGEDARRWSARVESADGVVFVMPEYNHSFSAPLKNAIDYLHQEWVGMPVGLVSYGGLSGGTRAVVALQPVLVNLGMHLVRTNVEIAWVAEHVHDGAFVPTERHERALEALLAELAVMVSRPV
ncbi:NADPH-dependent FMN reductase [Herbiconiux daphne]|uniref:NAD(P)H-dependent oxidoreductase n=1 Tax=Herbiconiux daphne TaxID=2970914 RepID=A0ABT2H2D3_9MICO|nr:NAD(P)H-dependent oxidoreductase [Herbiconiux daphne]MCS5734095.1 NAD(P)H-dependent oxidoreductase [Herbiconiux daphne]